MRRPETGLSGVAWGLALSLPVIVWLAVAVLGTVDPGKISALFSAAGVTVHVAKTLL